MKTVSAVLLCAYLLWTGSTAYANYASILDANVHKTMEKHDATVAPSMQYGSVKDEKVGGPRPGPLVAAGRTADQQSNRVELLPAAPTQYASGRQQDAKPVVPEREQTLVGGGSYGAYVDFKPTTAADEQRKVEDAKPIVASPNAEQQQPSPSVMAGAGGYGSVVPPSPSTSHGVDGKSMTAGVDEQAHKKDAPPPPVAGGYASIANVQSNEVVAASSASAPAAGGYASIANVKASAPVKPPPAQSSYASIADVKADAKPPPPHTYGSIKQLKTGGQQTAGKACDDKNEYCEYWSMTGECKSNPSYMTSNCPVSCNACS